MLGWYLEQVLESSMGARRHPLFFLGGRWEGGEHLKNKQKRKQTRVTASPNAGQKFESNIGLQHWGSIIEVADGGESTGIALPLPTPAAISIPISPVEDLTEGPPPSLRDMKKQQTGTRETEEETVALEARVACALSPSPGSTAAHEYPLIVQGLRKVYSNPGQKDKIAVKKFSIAARRGEVFGLLGPNGAYLTLPSSHIKYRNNSSRRMADPYVP